MQWSRYKIYAVGIGPGAVDLISPRAADTLKSADVIAGYKTYLDMLSEFTVGKEIVSSGMRGELERCTRALELSLSGRKVAVVSSGDAGIYAMAGLLMELTEKERYCKIEIEVVPGITAASAAAALLGAPLMNDFVVLSLSNLLTPTEEIIHKLECVSKSDMVCVLYNPRSSKRTELFQRAIDIFIRERGRETLCGVVRSASREGESLYCGTIADLPIEEVNMSTLVIVGSSKTVFRNGRLYTLRGYDSKYGR